MELLVKKFFETGTEEDATNLLLYCKENKLYNAGMLFGEYFLGLFKYNLAIYLQISDLAYEKGEYNKCYDINSMLTKYQFNEPSLELLLNNKRKCIPHIKERYISYPEILPKGQNATCLITFTITTCKRYKLFEKTINSFINCCLDKDLIDRWICVDDNSSTEDRELMKKNYPFFEFYFKGENEKGHAQSMNIIRNMVKSPYVFHMEDDWVFFEKYYYISRCLEVLSENKNIGQCLINKNYSETDHKISGGGLCLTRTLNRYYIHEYCQTETDKINFKNKYGDTPNCSYWPHYSLRPSLLRKKVFDTVGEYNTTAGHFEMEYADRYVQNNFISCFLEGSYCYHIGRLTSERTDPTKENAYILNEQGQFGFKKKQDIGQDSTNYSHSPQKDIEHKQVYSMRTFIVNLDKRRDRYENLKLDVIKDLKPERFSAVDGNALIPNDRLERIFEGNDYNMKSGMVGCALSHLKLYIQLLNSNEDCYLIFEDDITFHPKFMEKFSALTLNLPHNWDFIFLGHIPRSGFSGFSENLQLQKWDTEKSFSESLGGTMGYIVSKKGATAFLEFINKTGMTNCIDTMIQKMANFGNIYYCIPQLVYSPYEPEKGDVQTNYNSLSLGRPVNNILYPERLKVNGLFNINMAIKYGENID